MELQVSLHDSGCFDVGQLQLFAYQPAVRFSECARSAMALRSGKSPAVWDLQEKARTEAAASGRRVRSRKQRIKSAETHAAEDYNAKYPARARGRQARNTAGSCVTVSSRVVRGTSSVAR